MYVFQSSIHRLSETMTVWSVEGGCMLMGHPVYWKDIMFCRFSQVLKGRVLGIIYSYWYNRFLKNVKNIIYQFHYRRATSLVNKNCTIWVTFPSSWENIFLGWTSICELWTQRRFWIFKEWKHRYSW